MKAIIIALLVFALVCGILAVVIYFGINTQIEKTQLKVVVIGDAFLNEEISASEAIAQLDKLTPLIQANDIYSDINRLIALISGSRIGRNTTAEVFGMIELIRLGDYT